MGAVRRSAVAEVAPLGVVASQDPRAMRAYAGAGLELRPAAARIASVGRITAGQDWAIDVLLRARLALKPDGPLFTRGRLGPLTPFLPTGA